MWEALAKEGLLKEAIVEFVRERGEVGHENKRRWMDIRLLRANASELSIKSQSCGDIKHLTETLLAFARTSFNREQAPENDNVTNVTGSNPETWPTCLGCGKLVPEVNGDGLCEDCAACGVKPRNTLNGGGNIETDNL